MAKIKILDTEITIISIEESDYMSIKDIANAKESKGRAVDIFRNWLKNRYTLEFNRGEFAIIITGY
jgi:hypothetical protein